MNYIFLVLLAGSVAWAAVTGKMPAVMTASFESAKNAVQVAIGLLGSLVFFLGIVRILGEAGAIRAIGRALSPVLGRLFPEIPPDHPAMGAIIMNLAANILGMGNAATPFGLKAMQELRKLNDRPGVASNAMALFLVINTSGVAVFPLPAMTLRASLGSPNPGSIFLPSVLSAFVSCVIAVIAALLLARLPWFAAERYPADAVNAEPAAAAADSTEPSSDLLTADPTASRPRLALLALFFAIVAGGALFAPIEGERWSEVVNYWLVPVLIGATVLTGYAFGVNVYEAAIRGAREGFDIFVMIIPYLVSILVAVGMFRASGMLDLMIGAIQPLTSLVGFPAEALPMALVRPLSGSGASSVLAATMQTYGTDSFIGNLVCVMSGSTETTFYVLAVYYGSIAIRATRHTVPACLISELVSVVSAFVFTRLLLT